MTKPSPIELAARTAANRAYDSLVDMPLSREKWVPVHASEIEPDIRAAITAYLRARFDGDGLEPHDRILIRRLAAELEQNPGTRP